MLRKALVAPYLTVPPFLNYEKIVSDYCQSHQLKESIEALTEAILVAVDHRKLSLSVFSFCVSTFWCVYL